MEALFPGDGQIWREAFRGTWHFVGERLRVWQLPNQSLAGVSLSLSLSIYIYMWAGQTSPYGVWRALQLLFT